MRPSLPTLHRFAAALTDAAAPVPPGLVARNGADVTERFAVYRNNVVHSLVTVLGHTFPVVKQMVGDAFFEEAARRFVRTRLPESPVMHRYGDRFPDWLAGFPPAAGLPYLPDLARLEWERLRATHAADAPSVGAAGLAHALADPERLAGTALALHPSLAVLRSAHPVVSLWSAHQHDDDARDARLAGVDLAAGECCLVLRHGDDAVVLPTRPADADLAVALRRGVALGTAHSAHPGADLVGLLALLLKHDAVTGVDGPASSSNRPRENPT